MTKKINQVEAFLMTGQPLTVLDCYNLYKTFELRKIVCVLKDRGLKIGSQWLVNYDTGSRYKKYFLIQ
jgi:hypothetical protein